MFASVGFLQKTLKNVQAEMYPTTYSLSGCDSKRGIFISQRGSGAHLSPAQFPASSLETSRLSIRSGFEIRTLPLDAVLFLILFRGHPGGLSESDPKTIGALIAGYLRDFVQLHFGL